MPKPVRVITWDWDYNVKLAEARHYSSMFIAYRKGRGRNKERYVGGTEQQEGDDIPKEGKCKWESNEG